MPQPLNYSDTTPAAPAGKVNNKWQADAPAGDNVVRNTSTYTPIATATTPGAVPTPPNDATKVMLGNATWGSVPGGGGGGSSTSSFSKVYFTTAQRAMNTVYQNLTGVDIWVQASVTGNGGNIQVLLGATSTPATVTVEQWGASGFAVPLAFMVPPNYYYEVSGSSTAGTWIEWSMISGSMTYSGELSGSRTLSTVYQNTSGFGKMVVADLSGVGGGTLISVTSDSGASPSAVVWETHGVAAGNQTLWFLVPNNHYYKVVCAGAAVAHWNEYTFSNSIAKSIDYAIAPAIRKLIASASPTATPCFLNVTGKDMFVSVSDTPSTTGTMLLHAANCVNPESGTPFTIMAMSNNNSQKNAGLVLVQMGEAYQARQDGGSPTLNHWWEYTLG